MEKEEILAISRRENQNRDFAELDAAARAGNIAGRVGACVCCLVFVLVRWAADLFLCSPWIIYFSILGTHSLVKYRRLRQRSDLFLSALYFAMGLVAFVFLALRLAEARG